MAIEKRVFSSAPKKRYITMNKSMRTVLTLVLTVVALGLSYWLFYIINQPIEFEKIKKRRFEKVIVRLEQVRDAQQAYLKKHGNYAWNFDELVAFIDTGHINIEMRKDSSFTYYNKKFQQEMNKDTLVVRIIGKELVKTSVFSSDFYANSLRFVPVGGDESTTFEMAAASIERNSLRLPVFEVSVSNEVIFKDLEDSYSSFFDKSEKLVLGSLTEPNLSGNWR